LATIFFAGTLAFATDFAGAFKALRAAGAAFAAGLDTDFDTDLDTDLAALDLAAACLAAFLDFDAVLAMVLNRSGERMETGRNRLTPRLGDVVQATEPVAL
jgi:hypothetical protein